MSKLWSASVPRPDAVILGRVGESPASLRLPRLARRIRPYRLKWIEEFLIPEDIDGHRAVREAVNWVSLASGEHMYSPFPYLRIIKDGSLDILQPDINWVGGLTPTRKIAHAAEAAGLNVILHGGANNVFGQHFTFATSNSP